jgi:hypothetical protein
LVPKRFSKDRLDSIGRTPVYSEHKCWFQRDSVKTDLTV